MCGFAGAVVLDDSQPDALRSSKAIIERMAGVLRHRGPDDAGLYLDPHGRCAMAHRRLSVIDVAGGHQPLCNETGQIWVVFNGEIYNFRQLRRQLTAAGHLFKTRTDTEIIVHLYEQFGMEFVEHLRGMFAIALWDQRASRLVLACDRLGQKPLYVARSGGLLLFGSQPKAILQYPGFQRRVNPQAVGFYLALQYVPAPHSAFANMEKLAPATVRIYSFGRDDYQQRRYWRLPWPGGFSGGFEHACERLRDLLTEAVELRMVADVPLGAFLSGGIDSSIVVGLMSRFSSGPVRTFCIGFQDQRWDERRYARLVAERFATEHHEFVVRPDACEVLPTLIEHYDEPMADSSAIPTYYVSKLTRQFVTVALTGDGGDESFGGYERYLALLLSEKISRLPAVGVAARLLRGLLPPGAPKSRLLRFQRFAEPLGRSLPQRYLAWVGVFPPPMLAELYEPRFARDVAEGGFDPQRYLADLLEQGKAAGPAGAAMYADLHSYLPYDLLVKVDRASMAVALEARSPFLDHKLVEFAASLPTGWKLRRRALKYILKHSFADLLPPAIAGRSKMGFGVPLARWFRGPLRGWLFDVVLSSRALERGFFRANVLQRIVEEHLAGRVDHSHRLWALLVLELWQRRWIDCRE